MKIVKVIILASTVVLSTGVLSQGKEEICHAAAESDMVIKNLLKKDSENLKTLLKYIDENSSNSQMKVALREKAFWVYNRRNFPDDSFRRLSITTCLLSQ